MDTANNTKALNQALQELQHGNMQSARPILEQIIAATTDKDTAYNEAISMLGLSFLTEDNNKAVNLLRQAVENEPEEPQFRVHLGAGLIEQKELYSAEKELRKAVELSEGAEQAVGPWADCLIRMGEFARAEQVLQQALVANPSSEPLRRMMSQVRYQAGDSFAAFDLFTAALGANGPQNPGDALTLARLASDIHDFKTAEFAVRTAQQMLPNHPEVAITAAKISEVYGHREQLLKDIEVALSQNPHHPQLLAFKVNFDPEITAKEIEKAAALARQSTDSYAARELLFSLARYFDRQGDYQKAWETLAQANQTFMPPRGPLFVHRPDHYTAEKLTESLNIARQLAAQRAPSTDSPLQQIILAGPPRTGGSLLQTILGAAPQITSVGERAALLPTLLTLVENKATDLPADLLEQLRMADITGLERMDIKDQVIVDKTPHNLHVLGLIDAVHPGSVLLDVIRDPRDVFVSIMMHNLSGAYAYANDPELVTTYLQFRAKAMKAWQEDGLTIQRINYHDLVKSPEATGASLFEMVGQQWNADYLSASNRTMPVKTFSAMNVHGEINDKSIGRWKNYEPFIKPVLGRLSALAEEEYGL